MFGCGVTTEVEVTWAPMSEELYGGSHCAKGDFSSGVWCWAIGCGSLSPSKGGSCIIRSVVNEDGCRLQIALRLRVERGSDWDGG